MGSSASGLFRAKKVDTSTIVANNETRDTRRRNSLAYNITKFLRHDGDDFSGLIDAIRTEKDALMQNVTKNARDEKLSKIAGSVAQGSMRELRNQVISSFKTITRKYKDRWGGNTLLHIACQEGYSAMIAFILDPKNHSEFDDIEVDIDVLNDRKRTPLFLVFTPPTGTYMGLTYGLDENCNPIAEKPEGVETLSDWVKPGGPKQREAIVDTLIHYGADVKRKDFHGYTPLHYAAMWGWTPICVSLIAAGADINDTIVTGRTPLMLAVEFENDLTVKYLLTKSGIHINATDSDGNTALLLSAELNEYGNEMSKMLLQKGADPNSENRKKKSPLSVACKAQNMELVHALLDFKVQRRGSAFALLSGDAAIQLHKRLEEEEKQAEIEAARLEAEKKRNAQDGVVDILGSGYKKRSPWGQWVQYNDKRGRGIFYYNVVSRQSQW
eukprot:CAMPEP_0185041476 /NCGR_PEP_ID=MMETSP1103-20130426/40809_1 /TAXON_ID=36769 /ORGANISM="Paraphysomonas bandaiensis, Strain Caron Lab Isolate" /LENGTH=440 /DNA_ID=CAMNT_0027581213 /DNA_START=38 /DNA_END=1357 /DNA_ORIENTATION=-